MDRNCVTRDESRFFMDPCFFDPIFSDGVLTEERIEDAGVRIKRLFESGQETEAKAAVRLLTDILVLAIANGGVANPQACASHYLTVTQAALGEPTLLDQVKRRVEGASYPNGDPK